MWTTLRWRLYAPIYDLILRRLTYKARQGSVAQLNLQPDDPIAILGCGTGLDFEHLPQNQQGVALDLTMAMVTRAQASARRAGLHNLQVRQGDATATNLPDASANALLLHFILAVVPDPSAVAAEAYRIARPGARLSVLDKGLWPGQRPSLFRRLLEPVARPLATSVLVPLIKVMEGAGFELVEKRPVVWGLFQLLLFRKQ